ncbi:hypothetical protein JW926_14870, partial [Candidatus Sumerlaeota bacterium]|nr:hypothetical protein [Candidatus Sumerlaeota bacterium]
GGWGYRPFLLFLISYSLFFYPQIISKSQKNIQRFNHASRVMPYLVLTDLDIVECPPVLIRQWLAEPISKNLIFRIAVREVESWVMADREGFSHFIHADIKVIPGDLDKLDDPKSFLLEKVRKYAGKDIRRDLLPRENSTAKIGPDYTGRLSEFLNENWSMRRALPHSHSLQRTVNTLNKFIPVNP